MQIVKTTIVTSIEQLRSIMQHCILHNIQEGQVNLTILENGDLDITTPSKLPTDNSVEDTINKDFDEFFKNISAS